MPLDRHALTDRRQPVEIDIRHYYARREDRGIFLHIHRRIAVRQPNDNARGRPRTVVPAGIGQQLAPWIVDLLYESRRVGERFFFLCMTHG